MTQPTNTATQEMGPWGPAAHAQLRELDPVWANQCLKMSVNPWTGEILPRKTVDASITHMYAPGARRHIKAALKHGATMEEIMAVLKICVAEGVQACNLGVPILAEELEHAQKT